MPESSLASRSGKGWDLFETLKQVGQCLQWSAGTLGYGRELGTLTRPPYHSSDPLGPGGGEDPGETPAGTLPQPQGETSGMCLEPKISEPDSSLVTAEMFRKLLLTHVHPLKTWLPTPTLMCSVTFDTNLLTKVMQNQNGIPEDSSPQQVFADLDYVFSNVKHCREDRKTRQSDLDNKREKIDFVFVSD